VRRGVADFACNDLFYSSKYKVLLEVSENGVNDSAEKLLRFPYRRWLEGADPAHDACWQASKWKEVEGRVLLRWIKMRTKCFSTEEHTRRIILGKFLDEHMADEDGFVELIQIMMKKCKALSERREVLEVLRLELVPLELLRHHHPDHICTHECVDSGGGIKSKARAKTWHSASDGEGSAGWREAEGAMTKNPMDSFGSEIQPER
jgi:hypothetical protein